jgi:hypothetical protein
MEGNLANVMYGEFAADKTVHVHVEVQVQVRAAYWVFGVTAEFCDRNYIGETRV